MEKIMSKAAEYLKGVLAKERAFREECAAGAESRAIAGDYLAGQKTTGSQRVKRPSVKDGLALHDMALAQHRAYEDHKRYRASFWNEPLSR